MWRNNRHIANLAVVIKSYVAERQLINSVWKEFCEEECHSANPRFQDFRKKLVSTLTLVSLLLIKYLCISLCWLMCFNIENISIRNFKLHVALSYNEASNTDSFRKRNTAGEFSKRVFVSSRIIPKHRRSRFVKTTIFRKLFVWICNVLSYCEGGTYIAKFEHRVLNKILW